MNKEQVLSHLSATTRQLTSMGNEEFASLLGKNVFEIRLDYFSFFEPKKTHIQIKMVTSEIPGLKEKAPDVNKLIELNN